MTLIAFHAQPDRADILTDTLSYTRTARHLGHTSKVTLLPHLDAAVMTQGSTEFGKAWLSAVLTAGEAGDFDEFAGRAASALPALWERLSADVETQAADLGGTRSLANSVVFLVGWSPRHRRFTAYQFASDDGFRATPVGGLHVMPSPLGVRPSELELRRLERHFDTYFGGTAPVDRLRGLSPPAAPGSDDGLVELAKTVRSDRALADLYSGFKTYVGGSVIHTALTPGAAVQRRVHTFDDTGDEFAAMMAGSLHPAGQLGLCDCGSGHTFVGCCLQAIADDPCPCGSGDTFGRCCRVAHPVTAGTASKEPTP